MEARGWKQCGVILRRVRLRSLKFITQRGIIHSIGRNRVEDKIGRETPSAHVFVNVPYRHCTIYTHAGATWAFWEGGMREQKEGAREGGQRSKRDRGEYAVRSNGRRGACDSFTFLLLCAISAQCTNQPDQMGS